jgi:hypothetical protein
MPPSDLCQISIQEPFNCALQEPLKVTATLFEALTVSHEFASDSESRNFRARDNNNNKILILRSSFGATAIIINKIRCNK